MGRGRFGNWWEYVRNTRHGRNVEGFDGDCHMPRGVILNHTTLVIPNEVRSLAPGERA